MCAPFRVPILIFVIVSYVPPLTPFAPDIRARLALRRHRSDRLRSAYPCLAGIPVRANLTQHGFPTKLAAYAWARENLLARGSLDLAWNADRYNNAVPGQSNRTVMSLDYIVQNKGFVMDLSVLWACDPLDCHQPSKREGTPEETAMYVRILQDMHELVKVFGWSDPEHAFTNITSRGTPLPGPDHAGNPSF